MKICKYKVLTQQLLFPLCKTVERMGVEGVSYPGSRDVWGPRRRSEI